MARDQRRPHALLAQLTGEQGDPFLPKVGQLYRVNTLIYAFGHDKAAARPAVVLCVPPSQASKSPIQLVTRTSKPARGIEHPADMSLNLDRDGTFSVLVSVEQQLWRPENVELLGVLSEPYLTQVIERFY
jgi:hypothetical protein